MEISLIHRKHTFSCVCLCQCAKMDFFEFSGNEFELGENKVEREREPIIFLIWQRTLKERHNISEASQYFGKIWFWYEKRHNISERYNFGTRKHIEVGFKNVMFLWFYVSLDLASIYFLLARSGRKTDRHIKNIRMFIKFFMFFFAYARPNISGLFHLGIVRQYPKICLILHT